MYSTGIDLQQKLDKIMDYDQCNEDMAKAMGVTDYCVELFQILNTFQFWGENELKEKCKSLSQKVGDDKCGSLNEAMFAEYHNTQAGVLTQIIDQSKSAITQKKQKDEKLKKILDLDDDMSLHLNTTKTSDTEK